MQVPLCEDVAMLRQCKKCGLFFMPARGEDRCALCTPKKRNQPIDLWREWADA